MAAIRQSRAMSVARSRRPPSWFALTVAHPSRKVNGPFARLCRSEGLAAHAGAAADPEPLLQCPVFLAVLARRPDKRPQDDDHAHDRDGEQEDAGSGLHGTTLPDRVATDTSIRRPE